MGDKSLEDLLKNHSETTGFIPLLNELFMTSQRLRSYAQQFYQTEPILCYHLLDFADQLQPNPQFSSFKATLKQNLGDMATNIPFFCDILEHAIGSIYASSQQLFSKDQQASVKLFLYVVDLIDLLSTFKAIPQTMASVKHFIISNNYLPVCFSPAHL